MTPMLKMDMSVQLTTAMIQSPWTWQIMDSVWKRLLPHLQRRRLSVSEKGRTATKKSISFINMEKNKPLVISADQTNGREATGIYVSENGKLSVAGDVVIDKVSTSGRMAYGVANRGPNAELIIKGGLKIAGTGADEWRTVKLPRIQRVYR